MQFFTNTGSVCYTYNDNNVLILIVLPVFTVKWEALWSVSMAFQNRKEMTEVTKAEKKSQGVVN